MNPFVSSGRATSTVRRGARVCAQTGVLVLAAVVLVGCAGVPGSAAPQPATRPPTSTLPSSRPSYTLPSSGPRPTTSTTLPNIAGPNTDGPTTVPPGSPQPECAETPNKLVTPTGVPLISVTSGANSWIANWAAEPLTLAVYADGTALSSLGVGETGKPLPAMTLGYVPSCTIDWASDEIRALAAADMGRPGITDQGVTNLTYRPAVGKPISISAYALGAGDESVLTGKENRARFSALLAALRAPVAGAATWAPTRLRVVSVPIPVAGADSPVWPVRIPLDKLLTQKRGKSRCGVLSGQDAEQVLAALGSHSVYSRWLVAGEPVGLNIGALVPGQDGCTGE